ncbi:hypothetical protein AALP_AA5G129500 [Arabis alpina]|uniref:Uncharacterized protein n=1 Tax=Arabis alpina TaxID=50452 RepID=A0A087GWR6_ARAAL|nr:hypothetical protein AALP_AA5G129500 [Arabis alpina]
MKDEKKNSSSRKHRLTQSATLEAVPWRYKEESSTARIPNPRSHTPLMRVRQNPRKP